MKKIKYLGGAYYCDGLNAPYPLIIGKVYDVLHEGWHYKLNAENDAGSVYINKKYAEVVHIDEVETDNSLTIGDVKLCLIEAVVQNDITDIKHYTKILEGLIQ